MQAMEIAHRLAELGQNEDALRAYKLALQDGGEKSPGDLMNCALHILQFGNGEDYRISYTLFYELYNQGHFQEDILPIMDTAFYEPNVKRQKDRYKRNCRLLAKYPYLFRKDFPEFEWLPIRFYPFDDSSYTPFRVAEDRFEELIKPGEPVIRHHFFHDLENPILAKDVTSQYELEYLRDNVRKSEYVGRENHVYLHYSVWEEFCAWLAVLDMRPILEEKKVVFLIGDELAQYPIDFKERFGIDYSTYPLKPIGVREIHRMIWHTQFSYHNGGDFFNEVFDAHPNLLALPSIMMKNAEGVIEKMDAAFRRAKSVDELIKSSDWENKSLLAELYRLRDRTAKDFLVGIYLNGQKEESSPFLDAASRIAPVIFFQPHFGNISYDFGMDPRGYAILISDEYDRVCQSPLFRGFKYIKTFTPIRRPTTSYGATMRFVYNQTFRGQAVNINETDDSPRTFAANSSEWLLNRSFMVDWQNRLFKDCRMVRFEDGKLNPRATFTALAEFLDIPYTESMTYCSRYGERDPESFKGNVRGFDPAAVYRTYDEYVDDNVRYFLEYFLRDLYQHCGYDFVCYDGAPVDEAKTEELLQGLGIEERYFRESWGRLFDWINEENAKRSEEEKRALLEKNERWYEVDIGRLSRDEMKDYFLQPDAKPEEALERYWNRLVGYRRMAAMTLLRGLEFVNKKNQPLHMMPKLELDPALLDQPLYH